MREQLDDEQANLQIDVKKMQLFNKAVGVAF